ncbi:arginine--tRNA ligase [bacterium]|nr:arginine--tRNA ligase [bacterium]MBP5590679.1 arginine--tRNA ligase [bacterium]
MELLRIRLEKLFKEAIKNIRPDFEEWGKLVLQPATDEKFGDYQTNFAMTASKIFRQAPKIIAESLIAAIPENDLTEKIEVAGPGFINIFLKKESLAATVGKTFSENWDFSHINTEGTVVIDYSSPNIAKPMHVGHLRTTIIGDSIKRIMKFIGYDIIADNHLGDWGTQFGKLIVAYDRWLDKENFEKDPISELERLYIKFGDEAEKDPDLEELARTELKKVQDGDEKNMALWKKFVDITLAECKKIYEYLGVNFDTYYGESFYHPLMPKVIDELVEKGLAVESEGALVVFFDEKENLHPCIVRKKDGAFLYATSDLATIKYKYENYKMNKALYVTDDRQAVHFKQIFNIAERAGWKMEFVHIPFGVLSFNGEILKTRAGNTIKLADLFKEAESKGLSVVEEKNPELPAEEKRKIAKAVGIGALKYSDLSQNRTSNIDFSWEKALSFDGNTAPYLQYSYARVQSIKRKAAGKGITLDFNCKISLESDIERSIAASVARFPECVEKAAELYKPNFIADHIFDLVQKFGTFYNSTPILKAEPEKMQSRILLAEAVARTIRTGLDLLGIEAPEKM